MRRVICWFSCGAASAVATYLSLKKYGDTCEVVYIYIADEHSDNQRFLADCERWYGREISVITNDEYGSSVDAVIEKRKLMRHFRGGAPCSGELKKSVRYGHQKLDDLHVFGFTSEEKSRAARFAENEIGIDAEFPLIDAGLGKDDCLAMIERVGIELPAMYKLGYSNNNCLGCVKASSYIYWARIRRDFPDVFQRRAEQERQVGFKLCRHKGAWTWLDELPLIDLPDTVEAPNCNLLCEIALMDEEVTG